MYKHVLKDLPTEELLNCNGGHVPMAFYMNDDTIEANGSFISGFISGFFRGLGV